MLSAEIGAFDGSSAASARDTSGFGRLWVSDVSGSLAYRSLLLQTKTLRRQGKPSLILQLNRRPKAERAALSNYLLLVGTSRHLRVMYAFT